MAAPVMETPVPDYRTVFSDERRKEFKRIVALRQKADQRIKEIEEDKRKYTDQIGILLAEAGAKSLLCEDWRVTLVESVTKTLKKEKLLELGVAMSIIEKATEEKPKVYVQVSSLHKEK